MQLLLQSHKYTLQIFFCQFYGFFYEYSIKWSIISCQLLFIYQESSVKGVISIKKNRGSLCISPIVQYNYILILVKYMLKKLIKIINCLTVCVMGNQYLFLLKYMYITNNRTINGCCTCCKELEVMRDFFHGKQYLKYGTLLSIQLKIK